MYPWLHIGFVALPSYFVMISLACVIGMFWLVKRAERYQLAPERALDLALLVMISGFVGARLAHIIFEDPGYYWKHPASTLYFWEGGFVFYGGALFAVISCKAWSILSLRSKKEQNKFHLSDGWLDVFAPIIALTYAIGRIGCFLAGCCYGTSCELPWAVTFPLGVEAPAGIARHPTQLYAVLGEVIIIAILLFYERTHPTRNKIFVLYVGLHGMSRVVMEYFREDDRGPLVANSISISTLISFTLILFSFSYFIKYRKQNDAH